MRKKENSKRAEIKKVSHVFDMAKPFVLWEGREQGPADPPGDMHFAPQILLVLSGALEMNYGNFKVICHSGEFCLTGLWEPHRARILPGLCRYLVITLDMVSLGTFSSFHDVDWVYPFLVPQKEQPRFTSRRERALILRVARHLLWTQKKKIQGFHSYQWLEIHRLLWYIQTKIPKRDHTGVLLKIYPAIILAKNETHRLIPLSEAARVCGLSRSRFSDLFKAETDMTFSDFALRVRINAASIAMRKNQPGNSMKQIATDFGFSDVCHFHRSFRRIWGCTPIEFLQKQTDSLPL